MQIERLYNVGEIVTYENKLYAVISYMYNSDYSDCKYELLPFSEDLVKVAPQNKLQATKE